MISLRLVAATLLAATFASPALACSCARNPTAQSILASSVVFTGVAEKSTTPSGRNMTTTFRVTEAFKGTQVGARKKFGAALVARGRDIGAYLETRRAKGLRPTRCQ